MLVFCFGQEKMQKQPIGDIMTIFETSAVSCGLGKKKAEEIDASDVEGATKRMIKELSLCIGCDEYMYEYKGIQLERFVWRLCFVLGFFVSFACQLRGICPLGRPERAQSSSRQIRPYV